uniref:Uncharacterized protein n=1 Tax=Bicosoecida sp. CB-2014 TaxID=1486930 RepID=A0A7S1G4K3_9STRA|mmetsp:Transcript_13140/g.45973  ORF Transcript_13140/g.45973 Transcript_13140/m.45973 type:complete len:749 (+) Transcript_13140:153-2399(+)
MSDSASLSSPLLRRSDRDVPPPVDLRIVVGNDDRSSPLPSTSQAIAALTPAFGTSSPGAREAVRAPARLRALSDGVPDEVLGAAPVLLRVVSVKSTESGGRGSGAVRIGDSGGSGRTSDGSGDDAASVAADSGGEARSLPTSQSQASSVFLLRGRRLNSSIATRGACAVPPRRVVVVDAWRDERDAADATRTLGEFDFVAAPVADSASADDLTGSYGTWSFRDDGGVASSRAATGTPVTGFDVASPTRLLSPPPSPSTPSILLSPGSRRPPRPWDQVAESLGTPKRTISGELRDAAAQAALTDAVDAAVARARQHEPKVPLTVLLGFAFCGMGISMPWYCISGTVGLWTELFGPTAYPQLLLAYNASALLMLALQAARLDEAPLRRFGERVSYVSRISVAYLVLAAVCMSIALRSHGTFAVMIVTAAVVGVFDSVLYGCLAQLAAMVSEKTASAVLTGQAASAPVLFVVQMCLGVGTTSATTSAAVTKFFTFAAASTIVCLLCFIMLLRSQRVKDQLPEAPAAEETAADDKLIAEAKATLAKSSHDAGHNVCFGLFSRTSPVAAFAATWQAQWSCFFAYCFQLTVQSMYCRVPSQHGGAAAMARLSTFLVYSKFTGEIIGRQLSAFEVVRRLFPTAATLLSTTGISMPVFVVAFLLYAGAGNLQVGAVHNDVVIVAACALFSTYEGLAVSCSYVFAASKRLDRVVRARATSWLNLMLVAGCVTGIGVGTELGNALLPAAAGGGGAGPA